MGDSGARFRIDVTTDSHVTKLIGFSNTKPNTEQSENVSPDLYSLIILAEKYVEAQQKEDLYRNRQLQARLKCEEKRLDLLAKNDERNFQITLKKLDFQKHVFDKVSILCSCIITFIFIVSAIAVYRGDTVTGFKVLGYIGTTISLIFGAIGFVKIRQDKKESNKERDKSVSKAG